MQEDLNEQDVPFLGPMRQNKTNPKNRIILLWLVSALLFSSSIGLVIFFALRTPSEARCDRVLSPYCASLSIFLTRIGIGPRWKVTDLYAPKPLHW